MLINNIQLYINNQQVDTFDDNLGIRLNNILNDPTKLIPSLGEYSFTFKLPVTKTNANIFNNAHIPEKKSKFHNIYDATLYANDTILFNGNLILQTTTTKEYSCNLFTNKTTQLEAIFNDEKLNQFDWYVPFNGIDTINAINEDNTTEYYFPLVAYHPFNKVPKTQKETYKIYTPKTEIDSTNRWYYNSFLPSFNITGLLKHMFNDKGYTLQGDIITDNLLNNIYISLSLNDEQDALYNYGNDEIGRCTLTTTYTNKKKYGKATGTTVYSTFIIEDNIKDKQKNTKRLPYDELCTYNILKNGKIQTIQNNECMMTKDGITIPATGYYEITVDCTMAVPTDQQTLTNILKDPTSTTTSSIPYSIENMPLEFQLLMYEPSGEDETALSHNPIYYGVYPNEEYFQEITAYFTTNYGQHITNNPNKQKYNKATTLVDTYNNKNFLCGMAFSKESCGLAYRKNGNSWNDTTQYTQALYTLTNDYYIVKADSIQKVYTDYNNTLKQSTQQVPEINDRTIQGKMNMIVLLQKNTILIPYINTVAYTQKGQTQNNITTYNFNTTTKIDVRAIAPDNVNINTLQAQQQSLFDYNLNLTNFINNQTTKIDYINNILQSFNLVAKVDNTNKIVTINKNIPITNKQTYTINLDDRITLNNITNKNITFPATVSVQFTNNNEERGTYISAQQTATDQQLQSNDWTKYADKGFDVIPVNQNNTATTNNITSSFAYTVYDNFKYDNNVLNIPIQDYDSNWKSDNEYDNLTDGLSLNQRLWFRNDINTDILSLNVMNNKQYVITIPSNTKEINGKTYYLDYKNQPNSLLNYFFSLVTNTAMNEVVVECYITPEEYSMLCKGANVQLNDDVYMVNKIDGFDPTGKNKTKITLMN